MSSLRSNILAILLVTLLSGSVIQFGIYRAGYVFPLATVLVLAMLVFQNGFYKVDFKKFKFILIVYILLVFYAAISSIVNQSFDTFLVYGFFFLATIVCLLTSSIKFFNFERMLNIFLILSLFLCGVSLVKGFSFYRFEGVFDNPNGMGRFASVVFGIYILYFLSLNDKGLYKYFVGGAAVLFFVFLISSNSRGSLLSALVPLLALGVIYFLSSFNKGVRFFSIKSIRYIFYYVFLGICAFLVFLKLGFFDEIINKMTMVYELGNVTQGRSERWQQALPYISFFGQGSSIYTSTDLAEVHNNYIGQALLNGIVGSILLFIPFFYVCLKSLIINFHQSTLASRISFFCSSYFLLYSSIETGAAIFVVWLGFISYSVMVNEQ